MTLPKPGVILFDWMDASGKTDDRSPKSLDDWPLIERCTRRDSRFVLSAKNPAHDLELIFDPKNPREGHYLVRGNREHGRVERVDDLRSDEFKPFCPSALVVFPIQFRIITTAEPSGNKRIWFVGLGADSN
jgi:hypothetical protein